jgi:hypothetical protein
MRSSHVATTLAAVTVGLTAAAALYRRANPALPATATAAPSPLAPSALAPVVPAPVRDGVVLPFVRPVATTPAPEQPAEPARCGDSGGRTKVGAPCAARATTGGRCHHHPIAA